jgi:hypothetical protein
MSSLQSQIHLRPGGFPRLLPFQADYGTSYQHPDWFYQNGTYYGYIIPTSKNTDIWPARFIRVSNANPSPPPDYVGVNRHPVLWHWGMLNACSNFRLGYPRSAAGLYWRPTNSGQWGSEGQFLRSPRFITFNVNTQLSQALQQLFGFNTDLLDKYGVQVAETLKYGGQSGDAFNYAYNWNGWLDCHLPRDNVQFIPADDIPGRGFACFTTDNTKYTGGDIYEITESITDFRLLATAEYWRPGLFDSDPPIFDLENIKNFKIQQQVNKSKVCNKFQGTCVTFHSPFAGTTGVAGFTDSYFVQKQVNQNIVSTLGTKWQLFTDDRLQPSTWFTGRVTLDMVDKIAGDLEKFFGMKTGEFYRGWEP